MFIILIFKMRYINPYLKNRINNIINYPLRLCNQFGYITNLRKSVCNSLLLFASRRGYNNIVKLCLKVGANINCQDRYGNTPLMISIYSNNQLVCETLIAYGADVNIKNKSDHTALGLALQSMNFEFMKILIKAGTNLNEPNQNYLINLINFHCVSAYVNFSFKNLLLEVFMMFLDYGIDVNIKDSDGNTALITLLSNVINNAHGLLEILLSTQKVDPNCYNNAGKCALTLAIESLDFNTINLLLDYGLNINIKNQHGQTPLMFLISTCKHKKGLHFDNIRSSIKILSRQELHLIDKLLKDNSEIEEEEQRIILSEKMIQLGANIYDTDNKGNTVLHHAILCHNCENILKMILKYS